VASTCVVPGGVQTLTLHTKPGYYVAVDTQYSDGNDGRKYGGWGTAQTGPNGTYTNTWSVAATAPTGVAVVYISISGANSTAFRQPQFRVSTSC